MKPFGILAILFLFAMLASVVYVGMNTDKFYNDRQGHDAVRWFDMDDFEEKISSISNEEELTRVVTDAMTTPEALESCAELYSEAVRSTESTDMTDEKSVLETINKQRQFTETLCMATSDRWISLVD